MIMILDKNLLTERAYCERIKIWDNCNRTKEMRMVKSLTFLYQIPSCFSYIQFIKFGLIRAGICT